MGFLTGYPDCPACGCEDVYICGAPKRNGSQRLDCANPACAKAFTAYRTNDGYVGESPVWRGTKLPYAVRSYIEELWRSGVHPAGIARLANVDYRTAWSAARRLSAANAS